MKNYIIHLITSFFFVCFVTTSIFAQDPPPGPPENPSDGGNGPVGEGAPIDGGLGILLALGGAYGGYKLYKYKKEQKKEAEEI